MFSTAQLDIIRGFIDSYNDVGYKYYMACQNPSQSSQFNYDIIILVANTPFSYSIEGSQYIVNAPEDCYQINILSGNGSNYNNDPRYDIIHSTDPVTFNLPLYAHCATNCVNTVDLTAVVPDIGGVVYAENQTGGLLFMFTIFIFLFAFLRLFRR